jgi:hypothetical protein
MRPVGSPATGHFFGSPATKLDSNGYVRTYHAVGIQIGGSYVGTLYNDEKRKKNHFTYYTGGFCVDYFLRPPFGWNVRLF